MTNQPQSSGGEGISSASELIAESVPPDEFDFFGTTAEQARIPDDPGEIIDGVIVEEKEGRKEPPLRGRKRSGVNLQKDNARSGPPVLDEWMDFFSRVIIRGATDFYIDRAFADIDEELLTEREVARLRLAPEERDRIAKPFAELANKLKFTRKHGRMVIATAGSIDSVIQLGMWFSRVNRIANKYRNPNRQVYRASGRQAPRQPFRFVPPSAETEVTENVSSGQDTQAGQNGSFQQPPGWRPDVAGNVFNPDLG